jgi:mannose-6-phosphate isomerase-like protein (cupin superfamily)
MTDIFSSPDVFEPKTEPGALDLPKHTDARGTIHRLDIDGFKVNLLSTKKGFMRSGDLHKNVQFDFILSGKVELWLRKDGKDEKIVYGPNSFITIPPGVPHLFNFLEDTVMAEWWDGPFKAWYYKPYRDIIDAQFKQMTK